MVADGSTSGTKRHLAYPPGDLLASFAYKSLHNVGY